MQLLAPLRTAPGWLDPGEAAVIATAIVGDPRRPNGSGWEGNDPTTWVWPMLEVKRLDEPVFVRGKQGLWNWQEAA